MDRSPWLRVARAAGWRERGPRPNRWGVTWRRVDRYPRARLNTGSSLLLDREQPEGQRELLTPLRTTGTLCLLEHCVYCQCRESERERLRGQEDDEWVYREDSKCFFTTLFTLSIFSVLTNTRRSEQGKTAGHPRCWVNMTRVVLRSRALWCVQ